MNCCGTHSSVSHQGTRCLVINTSLYSRDNDSTRLHCTVIIHVQCNCVLSLGFVVHVTVTSWYMYLLHVPQSKITAGTSFRILQCDPLVVTKHNATMPWAVEHDCEMCNLKVGCSTDPDLLYRQHPLSPCCP